MKKKPFSLGRSADDTPPTLAVRLSLDLFVPDDDFSSISTLFNTRLCVKTCVLTPNSTTENRFSGSSRSSFPKGEFLQEETSERLPSIEEGGLTIC